MAPQAIIDLSLSTDDEGHTASRTRQRNTNADKIATYDSLYSSDGVDAIHGGGNTFENPAKRRKLSNSYEGNVQTTSIYREVLDERISPPKRAPLATKVANNQGPCSLSDDIVFTSSADINRRTCTTTSVLPQQPTCHGSDDSLPEDFSLAVHQNAATSVSDRTASLLANLKKPSTSTKSRNFKAASTIKLPPQRTSDSPKAMRSCVPDIDSSEEEGGIHTKTKRKSNFTNEEKATKAREKEEAKAKRAAQKAKDKDEEKRRKVLEREDKAREKQRAADLTEVNRVRNDKKETSKEMIVDLPMSMDGQRVNDQIKDFLKNLDIESNTYQSAIPNVIRWRRKVDSYFDEEKGYRVAKVKEIQDENHVLCLMSAKEVISLVTAIASQANNETLEGHVRKFKTAFEGCTPIYLIEGFHAWMRKNRNLRNREYQAAVLCQAHEAGPRALSGTQQGPRRKKEAEVYIDEDFIEDALLKLQVMNNCLIHHTATPFESAEWVANFTQHISLIPYK